MFTPYKLTTVTLASGGSRVLALSLSTSIVRWVWKFILYLLKGNLLFR